MLITRCPNCETTFRVRMEQLNLRGGRVRCGHCHVPFSALGSLEELPEDTATSLIGTPPQAVARTPIEPNVLSVSAPTPEPVEPAFAPAQYAEPDPMAAIDLPPTPLALHRTESVDTDKTDPLAQAASPDTEDDGFDLEFDIEDDARTPAVTSNADAPRQATPSADKAVEAIENEFIELGSAADDADAEAFDREFQRNLDATAESNEPFIDHDDGDEGDDVPQLHTVFLDEDIPQGIAADEAASAARSRARRGLWLGNLLLLITGTLLATYVMRVELTRLYPALRAPLEQACETLSCDVPYPRDADEVLLVGSDLTQATNPAGGYHLAVTVRNHARYPVAWPQLEITLTDRFERALTRRVLEPAEWLPANLAARPAFEAQGELTSQITLTSDAQVMGYRLGVFYR